MSFETILLVCLIVMFILRELYLKLWIIRKYPPGPIGIPFFGNLLAIRDQAPIRLMELAQKYGPIFSVKIGSQLVVVLDDLKIIKEAMGLDTFHGRPNSPTFSIPSDGKYGIVFSDGHIWKEQRKFALQSMTELGIRSLAMENLILDEVVEFCDYLKTEEGNEISVHRKLGLYVLNSLWAIVGGTRFKPDDATLLQIMDQQAKDVADSISAALVFAFPELSQKFPNLLGWTKLQKTLQPLKSFFQKQIQGHISMVANQSDGTDYIHAYLRKMNETTDANSSFYGDAGWKSLAAALMDLYGAGSESTSNVLTWAFLYISTHSSPQRKLQEEIDRVVGKNRLPCLSDKIRMPYCQALILEVLRAASISSLTLFRAAKTDVNFQGFVIPKGSYLTANLHSVHHNPETWGDPDNFRPERFLNDDSTQIRNKEKLLAFGAGGRRCIGEGWSMDVLFLFIVSVFQRFDVHPIENPSLDKEFGLIAAPKPFKISVKQR